MFTCLSTLRGSSSTCPHSVVSGFFLSHLHSHTLSIVTDLQVITCFCSEQPQVQWLKATAQIWAFASILQEPLFQLSTLAKQYCIHQQFVYQLVFREPARRRSEMATWLGMWVHGQRGCLKLPEWLQVCVSNGAEKPPNDFRVLKRSHPDLQDQTRVAIVTSVNWKLPGKCQIHNGY